MTEEFRFSRAFAQQWKDRLNAQKDDVWPDLLSFLFDLQRQGHTALPLSLAEDLWTQTYAPRTEFDAPAPPFRPFDLSTLPRALYEAENSPLEIRTVEKETWIALKKKAALEKKLAFWFSEKSRSVPPWNTDPGAVEDPAFLSLNADQQKAVRLALQRGLFFLTGGPGTGKTTTLFQIVYQILQKNLSLRIALTAPTGRAASRIQESLDQSYQKQRNALSSRHAGEALSSCIPVTLHRLLGVRGDYDPPRYYLNRKLPFDVVVVDEASMLDLKLLSMLTEALEPSAALIFIGDPNQLPSIESGAALTSLLEQKEIQPCIARLSVNQRVTDQNSGLDSIFRETIEVDSAAVDPLIKHFRVGTNSFRWVDSHDSTNEHVVSAWLKEQFQITSKTWVHRCSIGALSDEQKDQRIKECLDVIQTHVLLTPIRDGQWGSVSLSASISATMTVRKDLIHPGLPWMVTRNLRQWELANGDRGILLDDAGRLVVAFPKGSGYRTIAYSLLAADGEPSWAMTIHKSQGSEYRHVWIVLPDSSQSFLTKEWLYTGLTRARESVTLFAKAETLRSALQRPMVRYSGFWSVP